MRCARGRVLDVVVDLRRGSPTFGEWEAVELDDEHGRQLWIPVGFGHGFCVLSDDGRLRLQVHGLLRRAPPRRASASTIPTSASSGRSDVELLYSERDRDAPRLAEVADALPFRSVSPTAASPRARPASCTSATCARRCWRGCSRARQGARFLVRMEDLDPGRVRPGVGERAARATCAAIGLDWDGEVVCQSARHAPTRRRSSGCGPPGASTSASARGPRSARPPRRRTARCPRAPTPAPACG